MQQRRAIEAIEGTDDKDMPLYRDQWHARQRHRIGAMRGAHGENPALDPVMRTDRAQHIARCAVKPVEEIQIRRRQSMKRFGIFRQDFQTRFLPAPSRATRTIRQRLPWGADLAYGPQKDGQAHGFAALPRNSNCAV